MTYFDMYNIEPILNIFQAVVSGWGYLEYDGDLPSVLMEVTVTTMTNSACTTSPYLYTPDEITDNMICAAGDNKDACQGDSGGEFIIYFPSLLNMS